LPLALKHFSLSLFFCFDICFLVLVDGLYLCIFRVFFPLFHALIFTGVLIFHALFFLLVLLQDDGVEGFDPRGLIKDTTIQVYNVLIGVQVELGHNDVLQQLLPVGVSLALNLLFYHGEV
jgi:hypothetical protein